AARSLLHFEGVGLIPGGLGGVFDIAGRILFLHGRGLSVDSYVREKGNEAGYTTGLGTGRGCCVADQHSGKKGQPMARCCHSSQATRKSKVRSMLMAKDVQLPGR